MSEDDQHVTITNMSDPLQQMLNQLTNSYPPNQPILLLISSLKPYTLHKDNTEPMYVPDFFFLEK